MEINEDVTAVDPWAVKSVNSMRWADADNKVFTCNVVFERLNGTHPFAATAADPEQHCRDIFQRGVAGEWGEIAPFHAPPPDERRKAMPTLSPRKFWRAALSLGITETMVRADIAEMPDQVDRDVAIIEMEKATFFERLHWLVVRLSTKNNIPPEQLDDVWMWAASTS